MSKLYSSKIQMIQRAQEELGRVRPDGPRARYLEMQIKILQEEINHEKATVGDNNA